MSNLSLPGNPRYQPKALVEYFGYDNLARALVEVELAALRTLGEMSVVSQTDLALLTPEIEEKLLSITMSEVDHVERTVTKHDIRALVRVMQDIMPASLRRWVHVPLTSYDVLDTARTIQYVRAHTHVIRPKAREVIKCLSSQALQHAEHTQIGRTHGQHALPITVGFWFATILSRALFNAQQADWFVKGLMGKVSGAVGAYNAQTELGITSEGNSFEKLMLKRLGLDASPISTQILPPEPLAYYLYSCLMLSASLGQFGRDARHLMRTEIAELAEPFEKGQVGSSTMAHKRNPLHFENIEGMWIRSKNMFGNVLDTLISEHQRDLVGSSAARDFPAILVNLTHQLDTLLRPGKDGKAFLSRIVVDAESCRRNLQQQGDIVLAEPFYLALQMYNYAGDAHELINHRAIPRIGKEAGSLYEAVEQLARHDPLISAAFAQIPSDTLDLLQNPANYTGRAMEKALQVVRTANQYLAL